MQEITFKVHKALKFGQAVFLIGNLEEIGNWNVSRSFRLTWTQGHIWQGKLTLSTQSLKKHKIIEYKYLVASFQSPSKNHCQWEIGQQNRFLDRNFINLNPNINNQSITLVDDWNIRKIKMNLIIKKSIQDNSSSNYRYSIIGNCPQLGNYKFQKGNWKIRKGLRIQQNIDSKIIRKVSQKISKSDIKKFIKNQLVFEVFYTYLTLPLDKIKFSYYFLREDKTLQIQRHPGRKFNLLNAKYPHRYGIFEQVGYTGVYDSQNFDKPTFSKITPQIFLGSYLKNENDLKNMKSIGIQAIYGIQTEQDHQDNGISLLYLELLCKQYEITFRTISIQDNNCRDFVQKSKKAIQQIDELIKSGKTTYIYCSAGKYRSPQILTMYFILKNGKNIYDAIKLIQQKHPVAKPNQRMIKNAIYHISRFYSNPEVSDDKKQILNNAS